MRQDQCGRLSGTHCATASLQIQIPAHAAGGLQTRACARVERPGEAGGGAGEGRRAAGRGPKPTDSPQKPTTDAISNMVVKCVATLRGEGAGGGGQRTPWAISQPGARGRGWESQHVQRIRHGGCRGVSGRRP